jgi:predicted nuclease with TOPRIM domain
MGRRPAVSDTPETDKIAKSLLYENADKRDYELRQHARRLERERDEARERVKELIHENENLYRRLESVHEVYRLSSVCRELKAENEKLKQQQQ